MVIPGRKTTTPPPFSPPPTDSPDPTAGTAPTLLKVGGGIADLVRRRFVRHDRTDALEPEEADVCCGSGGAWGLRHRDLSEQLGRRKADRLMKTDKAP